ncbi:hypothetical protein AMAG_08191 [Allomyces macrogynus ATCC 38327]|uniref:C2 domain-containing protein n=1 Tax=Allomyces macrogynus (strain ATCC 38327) TaxID=578462 RepID=A0A0L0SKW8_ALLM3|nr:hypothetical protein GGF31_002557 [Allomyces arbusculus]KNE63024.1 hypothetical protein AMAG_08191 [Allomyces macrogynus ATCC 38327]|eukprot:KNE63024.1 hypothetical protein AMAG_08191 [Allomyces macrogynus ATCC 38327]
MALQITVVKGSGLNVADIYGANPQNASPCIRLICPTCAAPGFKQSKVLLIQSPDQSFTDQGVRFQVDAHTEPLSLEFADKDPQRDSSAMGKATISRQALRDAANSGTEMWVSLNKKNGGGYAGQLVIRVAHA